MSLRKLLMLASITTKIVLYLTVFLILLSAVASTCLDVMLVLLELVLVTSEDIKKILLVTFEWSGNYMTAFLAISTRNISHWIVKVLRKPHDAATDYITGTPLCFQIFYSLKEELESAQTIAASLVSFLRQSNFLTFELLMQISSIIPQQFHIVKLTKSIFTLLNEDVLV